MPKKICLLLWFAVSVTPAFGAEPTTPSPSSTLAARVACPCDAQMTLADCERDNPSCTVRPVLVRQMEQMVRDGAAEEAIVEALGKHVPGQGEKALCKARRQHRFLMLFFYEEGSDQSKQMAEAVNQAQTQFRDKADVARVNVNDGRELPLVHSYGIGQAPLLLVLAPNGVVIGAYPKLSSVEDVAKAFVSAKTVDILGSLQQRKVVFLLVQNDQSKAAGPNRRAARDVAEVLNKSVAVVELDPRDSQEQDLLRQLKVPPDAPDAVTIVIAPNGVIADRFDGPVTNRDLFTSFKKVLAQKSGCGDSCGGGR